MFVGYKNGMFYFNVFDRDSKKFVRADCSYDLYCFMNKGSKFNPPRNCHENTLIRSISVSPSRGYIVAKLVTGNFIEDCVIKSVDKKDLYEGLILK